MIRPQYMSLVLLLAAASVFAQTPVELLTQSGVKGGLVVHLGCGDGQDTLKLRVGPQYVVHGLDVGDVSQARQHIMSKGHYGPVSIARLESPALPYVDNLVNLIIVSGEKCPVPDRELIRVLVPGGKVIFHGPRHPLEGGNPFMRGKRVTLSKPWPKSLDEWTHYLRGPDNNAVSLDPSIAAPRSLRWSVPPRWGRTHEEMASMSAAVSAKGRLFYIIDDAPFVSIRYPSVWKLVACDAFNGTKLWEKPIAKWIDQLRHFRSGPVHLPRRLVAVGDRVYVTLGLDAPITCHDAATGELLKTYTGTELTEEIVLHNGTLYLMVGTSEISRLGGGLFKRGEPDTSTERHIVAMSASTGEVLWKKNARDADYVLPLSLTAKGDKVYYQSVKGLHCVAAKTGKQLWLTERATPKGRYGFSTSTLVVTDDVVLLADRKTVDKADSKDAPAANNVTFAVHGWNEPGYTRKGSGDLVAYDADSGKPLWSTRCTEGYNSPVDVFVIDDVVWVGPRFATGYALRTGEQVKTLDVSADPVGMSHARCHRNKAAVTTIFTCRDGIETIDLEKGWTGNNSWVRGTCQYGVLPANGLMYSPPDACGCHPKSRMQGLVAISSELPPSATTPLPDPASRLTKGPAFDRLTTLAGKKLARDAWPTYRADSMRSGSSATTATGTRTKWRAQLAGRLTQPVAGHDKVYVAAINAHTIHALDGKSGKEVWAFTANGRIDSSPTLLGGLLVTGSADGHVYCLDAATGELAWRFRAAPEERLISAFGQLESAWPVHGAVLPQGNEIVFTAGRSTYLDGGIYFYRMNPVTGKVLACKPIRHLDPVTGKQTAKEGSRQGLKFDSEGTTTDVLSGNGESVFLKHMRFDLDGNEQPLTVPHLFCQTGMLGEEWFVRSFWIYGTDVGAGWGGWASMKSNEMRITPAGRILAFDDTNTYGYGRVQHLAAATGHRADAYHLFSSAKVYTPPKPVKAPASSGKKKPAKKPRGGGKPTKTYHWQNTDPLTVRAMAVAGDTLVIAGVPDVAKKTEDEKVLEYVNPEESLDAYLGGKGGILRTVSKTDGKVLREIKLPAAPVFDGLSAASGHVYVSLKDGSVVCLGK